MPRLRLAFALAPIIGGALLAPVTADAAPRHVPPDGAHAGGCASTPCGSLGYAYEQAASGDVILVAGGSYARQEIPAGTKDVVIEEAPGAVADLAELRTSASRLTVRGLKLRALRIAGGSGTV